MKTRAHRYPKRGAAIACIVWLVTTGLKAGSLDDWTSLDGITLGNLSGIAYGMFVAVGAEPRDRFVGRTNIVLSSTTGTNWVMRHPGGDGGAGSTLNSVTFGDGQFVVVGSKDQRTFATGRS